MKTHIHAPLGMHCNHTDYPFNQAASLTQSLISAGSTLVKGKLLFLSAAIYVSWYGSAPTGNSVPKQTV